MSTYSCLSICIYIYYIYMYIYILYLYIMPIIGMLLLNHEWHFPSWMDHDVPLVEEKRLPEMEKPEKAHLDEGWPRSSQNLGCA